MSGTVLEIPKMSGKEKESSLSLSRLLAHTWICLLESFILKDVKHCMWGADTIILLYRRHFSLLSQVSAKNL